MTDEEFERLNAEFVRRLRQRNYPSAKLNELARLRDRCRDCDRDDPEHYMVSNKLWRSAFARGVRPIGRLCLACLERRLGRPLAREEVRGYDGGPYDDNEA